MPGLVPRIYKGKETNKMSRAEYEKMLEELGINKPGQKVKDLTNQEPDMGSIQEEPKKMAKGGVAKKVKMCAGCKTPAKCKAAGKCLAKKAAAGMLVIPVKMEKTTPTKYAGMKQAAAKKKKAKK